MNEKTIDDDIDHKNRNRALAIGTGVVGLAALARVSATRMAAKLPNSSYADRMLATLVLTA